MVLISILETFKTFENQNEWAFFLLQPSKRLDIYVIRKVIHDEITWVICTNRPQRLTQ